MTQLSFNGWVVKFLRAQGFGVRWNCPSDMAVVALFDVDGRAWLWSGPLIAQARP